VVQEEVGELGYGEDVDEVEEQLQGRDPLLAGVPDAQYPSMVEPLRHVHLPVCCQRATGRILPPAVSISYRPNGRVFRVVSVGRGIALPKNAPIVDVLIGMASRAIIHPMRIIGALCTLDYTPRLYIRSSDA
jgi:hypothetical protein